MGRYRCQCSMEFGIDHYFGLEERIEYPQYAVRLYLTVLRQLSQPGVASEQGPLARFRNRKCKRVWSRKGPIAASNFDRPSNLDGCQRLDAKTKRRKLIAQFSLEFALKE